MMDTYIKQPQPPDQQPITKDPPVTSLSEPSGKTARMIMIGAMCVAILILICIGLVYLRIAKNQKNTAEPKSTESAIQKGPSSSPAPSNGMTIISQDSQDKVGRTVFYKNRIFVNDPVRMSTEGIGWVFVSPKRNNSAKAGINAVFKGWETIPNSSSKYMLLESSELDQVLKIRIFSDAQSEKFFQSLPKDTQARSATQSATATPFFVEDLDIIVNSAEAGVEELPNFLSYASTDIERILQPGDAVTVLFYFDSLRGDSLFDENDQFVGLRVVLRRFGGKKQVAKESFHVLN